MRQEGTPGEAAAAQYIERQLTALGYNPTIQELPIGGTGLVTRNVIATLEGGARSQRTIVMGAHMDSKGGPGANDNGTGCGVLLELARVLKSNGKNVPSVMFVFFGGEEIYDEAGPDAHHWGSRFFVANLSPLDRAGIAGMISVDMVGAGPEFRIRNMLGQNSPMVKMFLELGSGRGLTYLEDQSQYGQSDHEPFEKAEIPSVWLEYRDFPAYHSPNDNIDAVDRTHVQSSGALLQEFFETYLTPERMDALLAPSG